MRSDFDLSTFAYGFRPWTGAKAIADGPDIPRYLRDAAGRGRATRLDCLEVAGNLFEPEVVLEARRQSLVVQEPDAVPLAGLQEADVVLVSEGCELLEPPLRSSWS